MGKLEFRQHRYAIEAPNCFYLSLFPGTDEVLFRCKTGIRHKLAPLATYAMHLDFFSFVRKSLMTVVPLTPVCDSKLVHFLKCMPVKLSTLNCLFDRLYLNQYSDDRPHDKSWCLKPQRHKVITCAPTWRLLTHCVAKKKNQISLHNSHYNLEI